MCERNGRLNVTIVNRASRKATVKPAYSLLLASFALGIAACDRKPTPAPTTPPPVAVTPPPVEATPPPKPPFTEISMKGMAQRIPVIMYHDVLSERGRGAQWFDITVDEFREQLDKIQEKGMTPISLDQLYNHLTKGDEIPESAIVLTFDDNYQGFYDLAYPLLKERGYPAAMFVHTGFVGNTTQGRPKMSWETLRELSQDPLITIGSHTITHPEDITKIDPIKQQEEISQSKKELETQLGKTMDYFAYPNGANNEDTQALVRAAGHKMAFSVHNGLAEESPNIVCINRYVHTRFDKAIEDHDLALRGGALGISRMEFNTSAPVKYEEAEFEGVKLGLVTGGMPSTVMSDTREGVRDFVRRTGAVAGINGGFFAMAAIASTDNRMVGPWKTPDQPEVLPDSEKFRWDKLRNRPLVMWGAKEFAIVPYQAETMQAPDVFRDFMPEVTDTFLSGVWLVHGGVARSREDMNVFASKDIQDYRKRAFMGMKSDGTFVAGASMQSVNSERLAQALASAGLTEAVLLDSGFSTSLVYGESIKAFGHSTPDNPSRPVPHAIVIRGTLDPTTAELAKDTAPKEEEKPRRRRRRRD
jgi:peptidoglycan/xylan/chitin deacetylase (PgdA/CDA1 family)